MECVQGEVGLAVGLLAAVLFAIFILGVSYVLSLIFFPGE
jgi:hypothetical protein